MTLATRLLERRERARTAQALPRLDDPALEPPALKWTPPPDTWTDRLLLVGGTGSGKSTLEEALITRARQDIPDLKVLVVDTKPRFQGERYPSELPARLRYRSWAHGAKLPDSYVLPKRHTAGYLKDALRFGGHTMVAQAPDGPTSVQDLDEILGAIREFLHGAKADAPRLLVVDEVMDFYTVTGHPYVKGPNGQAILRCARAGRERGIGMVIGTQRPRGLPTQLVQEANKLCLFRLRNTDDVERLEDFGTPEDLISVVPEERFDFWFYEDSKDDMTGTYRLLDSTVNRSVQTRFGHFVGDGAPRHLRRKRR